MKRVLVDTSSAILLYKAGLLRALTDNYRVLSSRSVYYELVAGEYPGQEEFTASFTDGRITLSYEYRSCLLDIPLRGGERDVVLLYLSGGGDFVLIDDKKGARYCRENGIPYTNALLITRVMGASGCIDGHLVKKAWETLIEIGRYTKEIREYAMRFPQADMRAFYP